MLTQRPKNWREGQTIFNFLEWLGTKGVPKNQNARLHDTFHLSDEEMAVYWKEFIQLHV